MRLFGDEAPNKQSVLKTITIDQNNTATVTYTSKEGKVIATAMAFQDQPDLLSLSQTDAAITVQDTIGKGIATATGLVGSKRLAILEPTRLGLSYQNQCPDPEQAGCFNTQLNCQFELWVYVKKIDGTPFTTRSANASQNVRFIASRDTAVRHWTFLPADSSVLVSRDTNVTCRTASSIRFDTLVLPAGSYQVEKRLVPKGGN